MFKFGEKGPVVYYEGFTQNGYYGNQPQPF